MRVLVLGWVAAVGVGLAGCAGAPTPADADGAPDVIVPGRPGEAAETMSGAEAAERRAPEAPSPADAEFIALMIPHHEQALQMAALAPDRAENPQVQAMASRIADVQGPEIAVLRNWLDANGNHPALAGHSGHRGEHGADHPDMVGMPSPAQIEALTAARGPDFDRMFLDLMIAHHQGALEMAGRAQVAGTDITAGQIADDVVATQSADIARMQQLYPS